MSEQKNALFDLVGDLDLDSLTVIIGEVSDEIKSNANQGATEQEWRDSQAMDVAEEAGEFMGAYRRHRGFARRGADADEVLDELSDVIIASMIMFRHLDASAEYYIRRKLQKIVTRGWVNKD